MEFNMLKMKSIKPESGSIDYYINNGDNEIYLNEKIGKKISISFKNVINCIKCGRKTKTSFSQGFCYPCFKTAPEADPAIIKPELDQSHLGISRDMEWAKQNMLVDQYVYLAISGGLKVGVTKHNNIPYRWIDQGATEGIIIAKTPNRYTAGQIEVKLKDIFADKTNWRKMLTNKNDIVYNLLEEKNRAHEYIKEDFSEYLYTDNTITTINYPVEQYPDKVKSVGLDKMPEISGTLTGIKGQYLIIDNNLVFNVRKHNGYLVEMNFE
jgi:hypothetical protein